MKFLAGIAILIFFAAGLFVLLPGKTILIQAPAIADGEEANLPPAQNPIASIPTSSATPSVVPSGVIKTSSGDIINQIPMANPPAVVKGIYLTAWSAGSVSRLNSLIALIKRTELNAVVIDVKDYSGYLSYVVSSTLTRDSGAFREIRIPHPNAVIKRLHDERIYVIARITAFQDPILAKAHPEWALKDKKTGEIWKDKSGLEWMDPAAEPVWKYISSIAKDGIDRGFDEINFDYVRFASDGDLSNIEFPFWDGKTPRRKIIENFFNFLRSDLGDAKLSADLFGLTAVNLDDMGIGQILEDAYENFDYVSPMIYPSHFAAGFLGYQNPAKNPYEIIKYSMDHAIERLTMLTTTTIETIGTSTVKKTITRGRTPGEQFRAKLRPWLQDFDLGAKYDSVMVKNQINAVYDSGGSSTEKFAGWLLWNPANVYTEAALEKE
ncbi:MAG: putative glycoside hydrolase [Patescibacteria group bacterium]